MTETFVLDACALLRFIQDESGADVVEGYLREAEGGRVRLLLHIIHLGEVVYRVAKTHGAEQAERVRTEIGWLPVSVVGFQEPLFWKAVELKGSDRMSYADSFAAALAIDCGEALPTSDPEFQGLGDRIRRIAV